MIPIQKDDIERMMKEYIHDLVIKSIAGVESTKGKTKALIKNWTFNLNSAGEQTINLQGDFVYGYLSSNPTANVDIQFSRKDSGIDYHNVVRGFGYYHPFDKLHVSWSAQPGETLTLIIGNLAPSLMGVIDNRSEVQQTEILDDILGALTLPAGATEVDVIGFLNNAANATLYTVPAGKTLYIIESVVSRANATNESVLVLYTHNGDAFDKVINMSGGGLTTSSMGSSLTHKFPIAVASGYTVQLQNYTVYNNTSNNAYGRALIRGYLL